MRGPEGDKERVAHILAAIKEMENYTKDVSFDSFAQNSMLYNATIRQLEIVGEACNRISSETREKFPLIAWSDIVSLRNLLIHQYFGIDETLIWQIVQRDIPLLK